MPFRLLINHLKFELMASIIIRNLDKDVKKRLRIQAALHGHSMEEEARIILKSVLNKESRDPKDLASAIRSIFKPLGGADLPQPPRGPIREPKEFGMDT